MEVKLKLTKDQLERLDVLLHDHGVDLADDGRDDSPDAKLMWEVCRQIQSQMK